MADLTFKSYAIEDTGVSMTFVNFTPGAGLPTDYTIRVTDSELSGVTTLAQLRTLVTAKLQRKIQAAGISTKLDPLIGQTLTI